MPQADDSKEEGVDELQAQVAAAENENLLIGLIELTGKILLATMADLLLVQLSPHFGNGFLPQYHLEDSRRKH